VVGDNEDGDDDDQVSRIERYGYRVGFRINVESAQSIVFGQEVDDEKFDDGLTSYLIEDEDCVERRAW
jgi:hypothetical protein